MKKCNCDSIYPFRTIKERDATPSERRIYYPWDVDSTSPTPTGHQHGCPIDVLSVEPGQPYMNCARVTARPYVDRSLGLLVGGPVIRGAMSVMGGGEVGLYRARSI